MVEVLNEGFAFIRSSAYNYLASQAQDLQVCSENADIDIFNQTSVKDLNQLNNIFNQTFVKDLNQLKIGLDALNKDLNEDFGSKYQENAISLFLG